MGGIQDRTTRKDIKYAKEKVQYPPAAFKAKRSKIKK